jgi:sugar/nucleoside kinase (ribokinase family)
MDDFDDIIDKIRSVGVKTIVTSGENGAYLVNETTIHIPAIQVNAVDTTGCGDAFMAGLIYKISKEGFLNQEEILLEASKFATATAAMAAQKIGAITSFPRIEEVDQFLKTLKKV